jgi:large subunit ribosomal protein L10
MEQALKDPRPEKVAVVEEVRAKLTEAGAAILTEYRGLPVAQMETLRRALSAVGGEYKVYKNTLVRRAAAECGLGVLEGLLEGPTGIAFVNDDVAAVAKALRDFARANPALVVKGGLLGTDLLDARQTAALAELPSKEVLLSQIAGAFAAPMQRFAALLQAVPQKFAYALSALLEKEGAAGGPAPAAEPPVTGEAPTASEAEAAEVPAAAETSASGAGEQGSDAAAAASEAAPSDGGDA